MPDESATKRSRRWLRLSVRGLIILVLVLGILLGWIVRSANVQRNAVAAIRRSGGTVYYDWQLSYSPGKAGSQVNPKGKPWAPEWLLNAIGHDYFGTVQRVYLEGGDADSIMAQVGRLNRLVELNIADARTLTDSGMEHLRQLTRLRLLWLQGARISAAGLANVSMSSNLESLDLNNTLIDDSGMQHLKRLTSLTNLRLVGGRFTDKGLVFLEDMKDMSSLRLDSTQITSAGLIHIGGMTRLQSLNLNKTRVDELSPIRNLSSLKILMVMNTPVDDAGLAPVAEISGLQSIGLNGAGITDAGLAHLRAILGLRTVSIGDTRVTEAGVKELQRALPNAKILTISSRPPSRR